MKTISRRSFLRGCGTSLALPWLEAMDTTASSQAGPALAPRRLAFVYVPNGIHMPDWTPSADGNDYRLPPTLEPLAPFKQEMTVISGLAAHRADGVSGNHARALAVYLTGERPPESGREIQLGVSADQIAAQRIGQRTRLPSLQIACEPPQQAGQCDNPYACVYTSCISWSSPTTPLPAVANPRDLFDRLFPAAASWTSGEPQTSRPGRLSVLDHVREDAAQLRAQVGTADRRRLDEFLTSVREVERRLEHVAPPAPTLPRPDGPPADQRALIRLMCDLLVLAWQTDSTRIATLLFANEFSNRPYPFLEVRDGHHDLSHHGNRPEKIARLRIINRFHVEQFAYLLGRLQATREGEATLLESSTIVYGCGNSDGNRHNHDNLPILVAGRGGRLRQGRHLRLASERPLANLWVSLLERMSAPVDALGDSTGPLTEL